MTQEVGSSLGRVWQGKLLQQHSDPSATAVINSSLACLLRRRTQCHDIYWVLRLCYKATMPDSSSLPYLLQRQTHPSTCASPRSACSTLLMLIISYPIMHCLQGTGVQEEGFLAKCLYYSASINCVYTANLTSLLFLFRPQPI